MNPPDARIRDFGSLNGTWVNGKKIGAREQGEPPEEGQKRQYQEVALKDGDEIQVGQTTLKVRVQVAEKEREPLLCRRCRKDVRAEVGAGRVGEYLCAECRKSIEQDPVAQIVDLLEKAGGTRRAAVRSRSADTRSRGNSARVVSARCTWLRRSRPASWLP